MRSTRRSARCATCGGRCEHARAGAGAWARTTAGGRRGRARVGAVSTHEGARATDRELEDSIRTLLARRAMGATICPSEAARAVGGKAWRELMEPARAAARRLVAAGEVVITQGGEVVDPAAAKGPIRIRRTTIG
ncbi:DUF3253 domain-containing protein [Motilibacter deserti]